MGEQLGVGMQASAFAVQTDGGGKEAIVFTESAAAFAEAVPKTVRQL